MMSTRKRRIRALLKGIETGDPAAVAVVNEARYVQHNPQTHEGSEGLAVLFQRLAKTSPRVEIARLFEDGDYVFAHTRYDFANSNIGFEVFRFEDNFAVEHWDNIQRRQRPNLSGHTMIDGSTEITDLEKTEFNREIVRAFVETILVNRDTDRLDDYIDDKHFVEHNPRLGDGLSSLRAMLSDASVDGATLRYDRTHRFLAEGNFVLSVSEGSLKGVHSSFYDLFRLAGERIVEHWDTTEVIPPRSEWKNNNGKF